MSTNSNRYASLLADPIYRKNIESALDELAKSKEAAAVWSAAAVSTFSAGGLAATLSLADRIDNLFYVAAPFLTGAFFGLMTFLSIAHYASASWDASDKMLDQIIKSPESRRLDDVEAAFRGQKKAESITAYTAGFMIASLCMVGLGIVFFAVNFEQRDIYNQQRCLTIQQDMLSAKPRMMGAYDAFQALGCKPQGDDVRIFVPPTDRERAAGKPLPWGGYPPSAVQ